MQLSPLFSLWPHADTTQPGVRHLNCGVANLVVEEVYDPTQNAPVLDISVELVPIPSMDRMMDAYGKHPFSAKERVDLAPPNLLSILTVQFWLNRIATRKLGRRLSRGRF